MVRSTFAGETLAAVDAEDTAVFLANMLESWLGIENLPVHVLSYCASLVDNMDALDPKVTEKRLKPDLTACATICLPMPSNPSDGLIRGLCWPTAYQSHTDRRS